jgi:predicted RNA-binding Zn-ribbon protein involved in translation (DUF1610 family)
MIRQRCPGQDMRKINQVTVECPSCAYEVELFSDEYGRPCPRCGMRVRRDKKPSCADWCSFAKDCLI